MDSSFINTFINTFKKSFSFEGRASRKEQLLWAFPTINCMVIFYFLLPSLYPNATFELICKYFFNICFFIPALSITVRRLHDLGYSGWFIFLAFIPIINFFVSFYLLLRAGNREANKYGPVLPEQNLTAFDKIWLWTFIAIHIIELARRSYLLYQLFNQ